jgi:UDPglucose 6-dehydrogenase
MCVSILLSEAPSLYLIDDLHAAGAKVQVYDPEATSNVQKHYQGKTDLTFAEDPYEALTDSDALLVVTEWPIFREPDFSLLKQKLRQPVIFDGRNIYQPKHMQELGFYYESIGRPTIRPTENSTKK